MDDHSVPLNIIETKEFLRQCNKRIKTTKEFRIIFTSRMWKFNYIPFFCLHFLIYFLRIYGKSFTYVFFFFLFSGFRLKFPILALKPIKIMFIAFYSNPIKSVALSLFISLSLLDKSFLLFFAFSFVFSLFVAYLLSFPFCPFGNS